MNVNPYTHFIVWSKKKEEQQELVAFFLSITIAGTLSMHQLDSGKPPGTAIKKKPRQTQKGKKNPFYDVHPCGIWKPRKKSRLLSGEQKFLCHHPRLSPCFPEQVGQVCVLCWCWELKQPHSVSLQQNKVKAALGSIQTVVAVKLTRPLFISLPEPNSKSHDRLLWWHPAFPWKAKPPCLQPLSSVKLCPQDSGIFWHSGLVTGSSVLLSEMKQLGSQTNKQTNTITSSGVRAYPTHRGKQATESVTHFMFTFLVQCLSTGGAGLYLILICAGYFDLTPLLRGRKAYVHIRHSRARDLHLLCYKSQCN